MIRFIHLNGWQDNQHLPSVSKQKQLESGGVTVAILQQYWIKCLRDEEIKHFGATTVITGIGLFFLHINLKKYLLDFMWFGETLWFGGKQIRDLCSEVMTSRVSVSTEGFVWWCRGTWGRGSLHLLRPTAWMSVQGIEALWSPLSLSFAWFTFSICTWGTKDWLWDRLRDSPDGGTKLKMSFRQ